MTSDGTPMTVAGTARLLQIITVALIVGVVIFAAILVLVVGVLNQPPQGNLLSLAAIGGAAAGFAMHGTIAEVIVVQNLKNGNRDMSTLCGLYMSRTIVATAILEGAAFMNLAAMMIEHHWWSLIVVGGLLLWMISQIPSPTRVQQWVEARQFEPR